MTEQSYEVACGKCGAIAECTRDSLGWFNGYNIDCPRCGKHFVVATPERVY